MLDISKWSTFRCGEDLNVCIYCGSTNAPHTDEHIMPQGMGGRHFLPKASCVQCQLILHKVETRAQQSPIMRPLRAARRMTSKKRKPPTELPFTTHTLAGEPHRLSLPVEDIPLKAFLPVFERSRMARGLPYDLNPTTHVKFFPVFDGPAGYRANIKGWLGHQSEIPIKSFARMLCKIAHCSAVVEFGLDGFTPFTVPTILGKSTDWANYVGTVPYQILPASHENAHHCGVISKNSETGIITYYLSMFHHFKIPLYDIIVGSAT